MAHWEQILGDGRSLHRSRGNNLPWSSAPQSRDEQNAAYGRSAEKKTNGSGGRHAPTKEPDSAVVTDTLGAGRRGVAIGGVTPIGISRVNWPRPGTLSNS